MNRGGHGVASGLVVDEVTARGFELVKVIDDWPGRGPLASYCAVFRKPRAADALPSGATMTRHYTGIRAGPSDLH